MLFTITAQMSIKYTMFLFL